MFSVTFRPVSGLKSPGCEATIFAAGARHRAELGAIDGGGAAKLAEAADRYEHSRFLLASVIGAVVQFRP